MTEFHVELDARNESCPMPVMKTNKALKNLPVGNVLHIIATDPGSVEDITALTESTGDVIVQQEVTDGEYHFYVRKS